MYWLVPPGVLDWLKGEAGEGEGEGEAEEVECKAFLFILCEIVDLVAMSAKLNVGREAENELWIFSHQGRDVNTY